MAQSILKKLLVLLLGLIAYQSGFAKCSSSGIFIVSDNRTLTKNGIIILEFYYYSQDLVPEMGKKYQVYLRSKNATVALLPVEVLKGEMHVTEIVFRPTCDLVVGDTYELTTDPLPNKEHIYGPYNATTRTWDPQVFTIVGSPAASKPTFLNVPAETKKEVMAFGCGPAREVSFSISADQDIKYVRAKVKNLFTNKVTTYIITVKNGIAIVGHGMCSGAFLYDDGKKYTVSFSLIDDAGNESGASDAIAFEKPVSEYER